MNDKVNKYFSCIGIDFPQSKEALNIFNQALSEKALKLNKDNIDPIKILSELNDENSPTKLTLSYDNRLSVSQSFFRRLVLAAKIVNSCYQEKRFGSVKFQKLVYLCEQVTNMRFSTNYSKQAAGPFDNKFMHSVKVGFEKQKWFEILKTNENNKEKVIFIPMTNQNGYKEYYNRYYKHVNEEIEFIINTFLKSYTIEVELVATIFACWIEIINNKEIFSNSLLIKKVYSWHPNKKKFKENQIINTKDWMVEIGIYPNMAD